MTVDNEEENSTDDLREYIRSFSVMFVSLFVGLWYLLRGSWRWVEEQHPFIQALVSMPIIYLAWHIFPPIAEGVYTLFWGQQVVIGGSLYVTGLPVPISIAIYFLLVLLVVTMFSNHKTRRELIDLKDQMNAENSP